MRQIHVAGLAATGDNHSTTLDDDDEPMQLPYPPYRYVSTTVAWQHGSMEGGRACVQLDILLVGSQFQADGGLCSGSQHTLRSTVTEGMCDSACTIAGR
jgi:hypothetical protein